MTDQQIEQVAKWDGWYTGHAYSRNGKEIYTAYFKNNTDNIAVSMAGEHGITPDGEKAIKAKLISMEGYDIHLDWESTKQRWNCYISYDEKELFWESISMDADEATALVEAVCQMLDAKGSK